MTTTATEPLRAFHGDEAIKDKYIAQAKGHREASEIVKHTFYENVDGKVEVCSTGCLTHKDDGGHDLYPEMFGIPEWVAYLQEGIFVGLPEEKALLWTERFLAAIPVGADFDGLADRLAIRRLKEECLPLSGSWPESIRADVVASIEGAIAALEGKGDREAAESAARSAAWSAESAAWSAAWSAAFEREADRLIAELEALPIPGATA